MSADGDAASAVESKLEEDVEKNPASGSKISKDSVQFEAKENLQHVKPELHSKQAFQSDKNKDMLELKKMGKPMVGLPPINMKELTTILQDPAMPSQDLMKEIAQKIMIRNEENESNAAAVNKVNPLGIRSLFECIMEVTLTHSDNSSDEEEDVHEPHLLEIPCEHCKKIFGSTMLLKTHILMSHSQDDPSVLNVRLRSSIDEDRSCEQSSIKDEGVKQAGKIEQPCEGDVKLVSRSRGGSIGQGTAPSQTVAQVEKKPSEDVAHRQQDLTAELSDSEKMPTSTSLATSDTTTSSSDFQTNTSSSTSSLRNRKCSGENQEVKKSNIPDLKESTIQTAAKAPLSSTSPPPMQSSSVTRTSRKRKSDNTPPSPSIRKSRGSGLDRSSEDEPARGKESVQRHRSSRRK